MKSVTTALLISAGLAMALPAHAGRCPDLAILLDISGSMAQNVAGNNPGPGEKSKWAIAQDALGSLLGTYDGKLPIGLVLFSQGGADQCGVSSSFDVTPDYGTKAAINTVLTTNTPAGNTPTCAAMQKLRATPSLKDATRGQYILLITDGQPNCNIKENGYTPPAGCNGNDATADTVGQMTAALQQTTPIKTFVVGFGAGLPSDLQANLDAMATAGGAPNTDQTFGHKYYPADNEATLLTSLNTIISTITGGGDTGSGTVLCDDSCYSNACPTPGDICVNATCKPNPCASMTCSADQYCESDGTTAQCVSACSMTCPAGQRCSLGQCIASACAAPCGAGQVCDPATGTCETDSSCMNVACKPTQGCFAGQCKDDPCQHVSCPSDESCIAFDGSCVPADYFTDFCKYTTCPDKTACDATQKACIGGGTLGSGCSCDLSESRSRNSALLTPMMLLLGMLFLRRRRPSERPTA